MKKIAITKTVLLTAALAGTMASCQKDEFSSEILVSQEMSQKNLVRKENLLHSGYHFKSFCIKGRNPSVDELILQWN